LATSFTVAIDWDHDGTWTDETSRTHRAHIRSGFGAPEDGVAGVGRCTLTLDNSDGRFSPGNTSGALYGKLLPRRAVRVQASDGSQTWTLFRGFVERIQPDSGEFGGGECVIDCTDAMAILARQRIGVAHADSKAVDAAISAVVSAAYTPPATRYADNGDSLYHYGRSWQPERTTALDALREICAAVYGRFYIARDGTATYISRDDRLDSSTPLALMIGAYWERIKNTRPANLIGLWRLNETSGTTVADSSGHDHDGQATGVTWAGETGPDGADAPTFDGVNDFVNLYSAGLAAAFNGGELTFTAWVKVRESSVWTDGSTDWLTDFRVGADDSLWVRKTGIGVIEARYEAGGTVVLAESAAQSATDWLCVAVRVSSSEDSVKLYLDGTEVDDQGSLGSWAGTPTKLYLGAVYPSAYIWDGALALVGLWDVALDADEITMLGGI
jgi:hypothetical protein